MSAARVIGIRVSDEDRDEIDRRADEHRMTRTEYMIRAALADPPSTASVDERIDGLESRVDRLERSMFEG